MSPEIDLQPCESLKENMMSFQAAGVKGWGATSALDLVQPNGQPKYKTASQPEVIMSWRGLHYRKLQADICPTFRCTYAGSNR